VPEVYALCSAFRSVVVETCCDEACCMVFVRGPAEAFEYVDIRNAMMGGITIMAATL
jgi:hypothetical protein